MHTDKPFIAVTMGDPCGIGPEIIIPAVTDAGVSAVCTPVIIGDRGAMERALKLHGMSSSNLESISDLLPPDKIASGTIFIKELTTLSPSDMIYACPTKASGDAVFKYISEAASLCMSGKVSAMATAPINKAALNMAGHDYPGHTELLAELTGTDEFVMMLAGDRLKVALVTIHVPIQNVPDLLSIEKVLSTIMITDRSVSRFFCRKPRIAVLSLNPHAGEGGMFGDQERVIISPAIEEARRRGVDASGPHSADTLFHFAVSGDYDAVVCMYHDQGLIPLKLLHFDDGVNITLGLPIIRTSVDHGTAYDLAGKGIASSQSMKMAILTAARMAKFTTPL
ncbi:MAG: 4-hydroxythreonine-4-phosphate dehydrogenase PdxA [Geobacteraceae bacterium]|nr:4-hydroxythreonine-4-phosphate dehydrogenase PdxA [Geobacteraceae bacterium]